MKQTAVNFCSILPELFSDDLDRMSMWNRIGNGITGAAKKCGGDYEEFVNLSLEYIKANPGIVSSNKRLEEWLFSMELNSDEDKREFIRQAEKKLNIVLVYARNLWGEIKKSKRPLKEGE